MVVNIWQNVDIGGLGPVPSPSPCKSLPQVRQEMSRRQTNVCQQNPSCDEVQKDLLFLRPGDRAGADTLGLSHWESPHPEKVNLVLPGSLVVDAEGMEDVQEGREEGKERCGAVELVVEWCIDTELRVDGRVGLQDSGAHVQNGCGAMVQTVQHFPVLAVPVEAEEVA